MNAFSFGPQLKKADQPQTEPSLGFHPKTRGNLVVAMQSPKALQEKAPESPRPPELLDGMRIVGTDILTTNDVLLFELMVSVAYANDPQLKQERHSLPTWMAREFLSKARRSMIEDSLKRLRKASVAFDAITESGVRIWGEVPMCVGWLTSPGDDPERDTIHFNLPEPVRFFMSRPGRYAYVELAALAKMRSKYGVRLYKHLLLRATCDRESEWEFEATAAELAEIVGLQSKSELENITMFKQRVLLPALADCQHSNRFTVELGELRGRGRGRGGKVLRFKIKLTPCIRDFHIMKSLPIEPELRALYSNRDRPDLQVVPDLWDKAERAAWRDGNKLLSSYVLLRAWNRALDQALTRPFETIHGREFRGAKLLAAITQLGAVQAAWKFCQEEIRNPDLTKGVLTPDQIREDDAITTRRLERAGIVKPKAESKPEHQIDPAKAAQEQAKEQAWQLLKKFKGDRAKGVAPEPLIDLIPEIKAAAADLDAKRFYSGKITRSFDQMTDATKLDVELMTEALLTYLSGESDSRELDYLLEQIELGAI